MLFKLSSARLIHRLAMGLMTPSRIRQFNKISRRGHWTPEQIAAYQEKKLRKMMHYIYKYVPFYPEYWKGHIDGPDDIRSIADLEKLPVLDKTTFRENLPDLITRNRWVRHQEGRTGGSTGMPLIYRANGYDLECGWAHLYEGWTRTGWRVGDPHLIVGGESIGVGLGDARNWKDWIMNRWVSAGANISPERIEHLARSPQFQEIRIIIGYPNAIREMCEILADLGLRFPKLQGVLSTAEPLLEEVRERIEEVLGVKVLDQWGLYDGGMHACEDQDQDGLYLGFHRGILEIVDEDNQQIKQTGITGVGLSTSLLNFATPFIRYETGDRLRWHSFEPGKTGRNWPRIGSIEGRTADVLWTKSGRSLHAGAVILVLRWIEGLRKYQLIQTDIDHVTVRLERGPGFTASKEELIAIFREKITDEFHWNIEFATPELTVSGKHLIFRNDWLRAQGLSRPPQQE